ncbi:MAG: Helix-turn-helix domain [Bacteroidota bacterium]|jgi:transcriptional regulator with XRE-family HTH domain
MKTKEEFQIELGNNIRKIRVNRNWSIEKLALETGLTYSQIGRIELGKRNPTTYTVYVLTKTLNVCTSEIFKPID